MSKETKKRTLVKTIVWRVIAIFNSFVVLTLTPTATALKAALIMNTTSLIMYYIYERICNNIDYGRNE